MVEGAADAAASEGGQGEERPGPPRVFISYRRDDDPGRASQLNEALSARFGADRVFFDVAGIRSGENYVEVINGRIEQSDVVIVVIGPRWLSIMEQRDRRSLLESRDDFVRIELEAALKRQPRVRVVPVLVDEARPPDRQALPRDIRNLAFLEALELHHSTWNEDVGRLIAELERREPGPSRPPPPIRDGDPFDKEVPAVHPDPQLDEQVRKMAKLLVKRGWVVPFLGPGVNADRDESWQEGCDYPPDDEALAEYLAEMFEYPFRAPRDLAEVSQFAALGGENDLYRTLSDVLVASDDSTRGPVHTSLARLPERIRALTADPRYPLFVTTNYDDELERAFAAEGEDYDLAIYVATGDHRGKFIHVPYDGDAGVPIDDPATYLGFPIDRRDNVDRPVIVKIHGAVNTNVADDGDGAGDGDRGFCENYVITEEHYIDYLSHRAVKSVVPVQLLNKLQRSHMLFLGYRVREWNLRVALQRIWGGGALKGSGSWAVQPDPSPLDRELWRHLGPELYALSTVEYVQALDRYLDALRD